LLIIFYKCLLINKNNQNTYKLEREKDKEFQQVKLDFFFFVLFCLNSLKCKKMNMYVNV